VTVDRMCSGASQKSFVAPEGEMFTDNSTGSHLMKLLAGRPEGNKRRCFFTQGILKILITGCCRN